MHDSVRVRLGHGDKVWQVAIAALQTWRMFPAGWTKVLPVILPREGLQVLIAFRLLGLWWLNPARIIYVTEERQRFGFAYGTLPGHVAQGEEFFGVERDASGDIYYVLNAFSRPMWWGAKLLKPYMRAQQARFRRESAKAMQAFVAEHAPLHSEAFHDESDDAKGFVFERQLR